MYNVAEGRPGGNRVGGGDPVAPHPNAGDEGGVESSAASAAGEASSVATGPLLVSGENQEAPAPSSVASAQKGPYPAPAATPNLAGPEGLFFDFNEGCRLFLPLRERGLWRARLRDRESGNVLFETETRGGLIRSSKRWFVNFSVEVWSVEEGSTEPRQVLSHDYDATDRDVVIHFPVGTVGDSIAWFAYAVRFGDQHPGSRVTCVMSGQIIPLFRDAYPQIRFLTAEEAAASKVAESAYATYYLGLFFTDVNCEWQPTDFRHVGLHKTAAYILGLDTLEAAPNIKLEDASRPIAEPYVLIAVQASSAAKMWNNPNGWREVIAFLKSRGFRVLCIDHKPAHGQGIVWNQIPHGCEDFTGRSLIECARLLKHAELFVGLSSGLSWLAWATGCPVVMISGFSHVDTEFATPYRVINWHTCNSCWNDSKFVFDHKDFLWCPRHANTPRQFECTRLITPAHVIRTIEKTPALAQSRATPAAG